MASRWNLRARNQETRKNTGQGFYALDSLLSEPESANDQDGLASPDPEHVEGGLRGGEQEHDEEKQFAQRVPSHNAEDELSSPPGSDFSPEPESSEDLSGAEEALHQLELDELPANTAKRSRLKRPRSETLHSIDGLDTSPHPFKRVKGSINHQYIRMLNVDIQDACDLNVLHLWPALPASQIGLTFWDPEEKHFFFETLGRLGKHQPHLIAQRIGTKSEMEVHQYIELLEQGKMERKRAGKLEVLAMHDIPAAVELSQECVAALEHAADAVSLRQEAYEEKSQYRHRPDVPCFLTNGNYADLINDLKNGPEVAGPLYFFKVKNWLELSARLFMNAAYEEGNWQGISHEPPSIRLDALADFYALARAITRKLVAEAIFNAKASNRGRARKAGLLIVRRSHVPFPERVEAKKQLAGRELFFAGCARRLRLLVVDNEDDHDDHEAGSGQDEAGAQAMSYDEVERRLSSKPRAKHGANERANAMSVDMDSSDEESLDPGGNGTHEYAHREPYLAAQVTSPVADHTKADQWDLSDNSISTVEMEDSDLEVEMEADEALIHSALGIPTDTRSKNALRLRIRAELEREELADAADRRAGYVEERHIWGHILGRKPTVAMERVPDIAIKLETAAAIQCRKLTVDDAIPSSGVS